MASNDPSDTGGLFIGRRPGTAPVRYREDVEPSGPRRQRTDLRARSVIEVARGRGDAFAEAWPARSRKSA